MSLPTFDHEALYQQFLSDGVKQSERTAWYARKAEELGVKPATIRKIISDARDAELYADPNAKVTAAQLVANEIGATRAAALRKLNKLLNAKRHIFVHDREGNVKDDYYEDDLRTQLAAAEKILKVHSAMSDKLEVLIDRSEKSDSDEALDKRIADLEKRLEQRGG